MLVYFFRMRRLSPPFNHYPKLEEMLALRSIGWSYGALAERFGVEKLTIRYICRKFGLADSIKPTIFRATPKPQITFYDEERINPGKSYAEYLQDERDRKWRRLTQSHVQYPRS